MKPKYYVLMVMHDVDPELHGPFADAVARDRHARRLRTEHGDEHGIFTLEVSGKGVPKVGTYSGKFFTMEGK